MNFNRISTAFSRLSWAVPKIGPKRLSQPQRALSTLFSTRVFSGIKSAPRFMPMAKIQQKSLLSSFAALKLDDTTGQEVVTLCGKITEKQLQNVGKNTKHVTLSKDSFFESSPAELWKKGKNIERLTLDQVTFSDENDLKALIEHLPLHTLEIKNCHGLSQKSLRMVVDTKEKLRFLLIENSDDIDRAMLLYFTRSRSLEKIIFVNCIRESFVDLWDAVSATDKITFIVRNPQSKTHKELSAQDLVH